MGLLEFGGVWGDMEVQEEDLSNELGLEDQVYCEIRVNRLYKCVLNGGIPLFETHLREILSSSVDGRVLQKWRVLEYNCSHDPYLPFRLDFGIKLSDYKPAWLSMRH